MSTDTLQQDDGTIIDDWKAFMLEAYLRFHELVALRRETFPGVFPFHICEAASAAPGNFIWSWSVPSEIMETINGINTWCLRLYDWSLWLEVLKGYSDDERWELEHHFVEPLAFFCMVQPSAVSERLLEVAENAVHQANRTVSPEEKDQLDQDGLKPGQRLGIRSRLKQLDRIATNLLVSIVTA